MSALRIMLVDDSTERAQVWANDLAKLGIPDLVLDVPSNVQAGEAIKALNIRRLKARRKEQWRDQPCHIDGVNILLLDFDLIEFESGAAEFGTGEEIAYLARVFSTADVICVVNQFGISRFDLTLQVDLASRNDLDIGSEQMANPGLWRIAESWKGFRPWHWPVLPREVEYYSRRLADVRKNLHVPILEYFGFDPKGEDPGRTLSSEALSFFRGEPHKVTFASVVESSSFVHAKDIPWLKSDEDQLGRVATAIVQKWLRKYVFLRQDILVDVPHLASRKPWLLVDPRNSDVWHATTRPDAAEKVLIKEVQQFRFKHEYWSGRPMYWGERINAEAGLALPPAKWNYEGVPELVFREDTSTFGRPENSQEFDCGLGTGYDSRFVTDPEKERKFDGVIDSRRVEYFPAIKLLM